MRMLFASGNAYLPEFTGGVQSNTDYLARMFSRHGHDVRVLAALFGHGVTGLRSRVAIKLGRKSYATDHLGGYRVLRAWNPEQVVDEIVSDDRPNVAIVQCHRSVPLGRAFARRGVPLVVYLHNVEFDELGGDPRDLPGAVFVANSAFTAAAYRREFDIESTVIPPSIDRCRYETSTTGEFVTFININEKKGLGKALSIAHHNPDIAFLFVESWILSDAEIAAFENAVKSLPNVSLMRRQSDMRKVYGRTRILLAPSRWEEAWGRVASEAHCSGIPVLGSSRGGLPEAIGPGGVVMDYDAPVEMWSEALRSLWFDDAALREMSEKARSYSERPEMDAGHQIETLRSLIQIATSEIAGRSPKQRQA